MAPAGPTGSYTADAVVDAQKLERESSELVRRLIGFDTVNPPGNERAALEFLKARLTDCGFDCELLGAVDERPNLIARLAGRADGPTLCYLGHIDTVPADARDWSVDPWSGTVRDGCVWGRGALDMKGQVAAEVSAASLLAREGWRPEAGELLIVITADEEAGSAYGAKWLCEQVPDKVRCDLVVNEGGGARFEYEGRGLYELCVAEKGVFRFTLSVAGRAGHASIPAIGDNALIKLAPILEALADRRPELEPAPEVDAFFEALGVDSGAGLEAALERIMASDRRLAALVEPMLRVTLSPTMVRASEAINVIPARSELRVDCRVPPGFGADHALERVREVLGTDGYELRFDEQVVGNRSPLDGLLADEIRGFVTRSDPGAKLAPMMLPGFTDSRWFRTAFPDCVAYGFFPKKTMGLFESSPLVHSADERIAVDDLELGTRFFAELATGVLG